MMVFAVSGISRGKTAGNSRIRASRSRVFLPAYISMLNIINLGKLEAGGVRSESIIRFLNRQTSGSAELSIHSLNSSDHRRLFITEGA